MKIIDEHSFSISLFECLMLNCGSKKLENNIYIAN